MELNYDTTRDWILDQLRQIESKPCRTRITKVHLNEDGKVGATERQKMVPLESLPLLSNKQDLVTIEGICSAILVGYLAKAKTFKFEEASFDDLFQEAQTYLKTKQFTFRTIGFIIGCSIERSFDCGTVKVGPPTVEYLEYLYNTWGPAKPPPFTSLGGDGLETLASISLCSGLTMFVNEQPARDHNEVESVRDHVEAILQAIALTHGVGNTLVVTPIYTFSYLYHGASGVKTDYLGDFTHFPGRILKPFRLSPGTVEERYSQIRKVDSKNFFVLDKMLSALGRENRRDKFLDLMIAIESVFVNIKTELRYRLSLSCAAIHGRNRQVYCDMLRLYKLRSRIVHGEKGSAELNAELLCLDEIARPVILYALERLADGLSLKKIGNEVEELLLSNKDEKTGVAILKMK